MSQLNYNILAIARCTSQFRSEKMAEYGLKAFHISYLLNISNYPGISQDKLAQLICINKSNIARQAVILEEDGYIERRPSQSDKRVMELYPTEKTKALMPQIQSVLRQWETLLTEDLSEEELKLLVSILQRVKQKASDWMEGK